MKKYMFYILLISFLLVISCSSKEVKKVSEESLIAKEAITVLEEIRNAYTMREIKVIERNSTRDGFRKITNLMKKFEYAELTFTPVLIEIEDEKVSLNISWKGLWNMDGKSYEDRGMAVFVLRGKPLKVDDILRANPFSYPQ